jgi:hypothetical protein
VKKSQYTVKFQKEYLTIPKKITLLIYRPFRILGCRHIESFFKLKRNQKEINSFDLFSFGVYGANISSLSKLKKNKLKGV